MPDLKLSFARLKYLYMLLVHRVLSERNSKKSGRGATLLYVAVSQIRHDTIRLFLMREIVMYHHLGTCFNQVLFNIN